MNNTAMSTGNQQLKKNGFLRNNPVHQSGAVLVISLIMLLLLTLIGVTGMQTTSLEEKMAGNTRDRSVAFQAAESALRDAENDITTSSPLPHRDVVASTWAANCANGLCSTLATGTNGDKASISTMTTMATATSATYGQFTGAPALPSLSAQPRYIIQKFSSASNIYYRVTVRAQGINANTVVWLQAVYQQL
jgi:type IV pilus assembly protein PilX